MKVLGYKLVAGLIAVLVVAVIISGLFAGAMRSNDSVRFSSMDELQATLFPDLYEDK
ncbi:MAG: hypothetical protein AAFO91_14920 [Bacteroidota bacterium]